MLRYQTLKENSETILKEVNITHKGITKDNNKLLYSLSFSRVRCRVQDFLKV